jgi:hypothetical protein
MSRYYYDFHVHSCLSPCADDDNTPNNLAGMASLCGINIMALTDHNSCKNCPAFFEAAKRNGIIPIAGMELTTSEDIHIICLFEFLENALEFDKALSSFRTPFPNRVDIFGQQMIMDGEDNVIGIEDNFLPVATSLSIEDAVKLVKEYDGICYPAHIDRQANGIISTLGVMPEKPEFSCVEFHDAENREEYTKKYGLYDKKVLVGSDTHYLTDMRDENDWFEIDDTQYSSSIIRHKLFEMLR